MQLLTLPFIIPVIKSLGFDVLWFGVIIVLLIEIGQVTPPVGLNLFVIQGIAGPRTSVTDIFMGSMPFLIICVVMMLLLTFFPGITTVFPRAIGL